MMSMNVSVEVGLGRGSKARFVMVARLVQSQVKHHTDIRRKWLDLVHGVQAGKYDVTLKVKAANATTTKTTNPNQLISVFKVATRAAPTFDQSNQKGQTLPSGEIPPCATKLNLLNQYGQDESYQEAKKLLMVQHANAADVFIKGSDFFKVDAVALARLLMICFGLTLWIDFENILQGKPLEVAIPQMILIMVVSLCLLLHMEGTNHLRYGTMQNTMNNQFLWLLIGSRSIIGTYAEDSNSNIYLIDSSASDGKALEEGDYIKAAALILATMTIGGAAAWWMLKRRAAPEFEIDRGLMQSPVPRKNNAKYVIHPKLD